MITQRLSHIGLCVTDLEHSMTFYREVFGYEEVSRVRIGPEADALLDLENTDLDAVYMQRPGEDTRIELLYYRTPGNLTSDELRPVNLTGLTHLSFRVSDFDAVIEAAKKHGGDYIESSATINEAFHVKAGFVTDPDGMRIELLQAPGDPDMLPGQA
jgi:catechol 2,3-dioxygenase-like lactoylglutathione lyase family enzyme